MSATHSKMTQKKKGERENNNRLEKMLTMGEFWLSYIEFFVLFLQIFCKFNIILKYTFPK